MNTSPCLLVFLLTLTSATVGKIAGESEVHVDDAHFGQAQELCAEMDCAMPACEGAFTPEGECCPQCPTCTPGDTWNDGPCTTCRCQDDYSVACLGTPLRIPGCPKSMWVTDECGVPHCPECIPGTLWNPDACNTCFCFANDGSEPIAHCSEAHCPDLCTPGQTWNPDTCTTCTCQDDFSVGCVGTPLSTPDCPESMWVTDECNVPHCPDCEDVLCEPLDCPEKFQRTKRKECCPQCNRRWYRLQRQLARRAKQNN